MSEHRGEAPPNLREQPGNPGPEIAAPRCPDVSGSANPDAPTPVDLGPRPVFADVDLGKWLWRPLAVLCVIAAVVIALLWQRYVSAPSPEAICAHKIELTRKATQDRAQNAGQRLIAKLQQSCVESAKRRIRLEGKIEYAKYARCIAQAQNLDEAEGC